MPRTDLKALSYRESLRESLESLDEAAESLAAWLEDVDARVFLPARRDVARAPNVPYRVHPTLSNMVDEAWPS